MFLIVWNLVWYEGSGMGKIFSHGAQGRLVGWLAGRE